MSTTNQIASIIKAAIERTPALSALQSDAIFIGTPPAGKLPCVSIDGNFSIEAKSRQRGANLHIWLKPTNPKQAGDILDLADAFCAGLKGTAIQTSNWSHQPDTTSQVDHVVFPVVVYLDLL